MQHICFQNFRNYTNAAVYIDYKLSERDMISKQIICQGALKDTICKNTLYISLHLKILHSNQLLGSLEEKPDVK